MIAKKELKLFKNDHFVNPAYDQSYKTFFLSKLALLFNKLVCFYFEKQWYPSLIFTSEARSLTYIE